MANGLYDSGKPQRIIVEHEHRHTVEVARRPELSWCYFTPSTQCVGSQHAADTWCRECPLRPENARVTITPQFEHVEERKKLK